MYYILFIHSSIDGISTNNFESHNYVVKYTWNFSTYYVHIILGEV